MKGQTIAVLGLRHGARHVHGFLAAGAKKIHAVDLNPELYKGITDKRVFFSQDFKAILSDSDMIVISLPPSLHKEALLAALETDASKIWVEKPLLDIGEEDTGTIDPRGRVEVIHELRRCQVIRNWVAQGVAPNEVWLTWCRPVPPAYDANRYPVGVVHDLGSHLIDLAFAITHQNHMPILSSADISFSSDTKAQDSRFTLNFNGVPVHIRAAWVSPEDWPEQEITVRLRTPSGGMLWASRKSTHRHLTEGETPTTDQVAEEKDWYSDAVRGKPTYFAPLDIAKMVHDTCNNVVVALKKGVKV